ATPERGTNRIVPRRTGSGKENRPGVPVVPAGPPAPARFPAANRLSQPRPPVRLKTARPSARGPAVALSPVDRDLLRRCLDKDPGSWNDFVDRFLSLIYHTIHYTAYLRSA